MFVNIIESYRNVVAIADEDLIGKQFFDGKKQLDVKESFYKGENAKPLSAEEIKEIMIKYSKEDSTFNIVGKNSIACALEVEIISEGSIMKIGGIPYSLILL
ncbi:hypothetical protein COU58_01400 [Candidatus Pacearchaeota archaeon CG10_big_fil_rev_8_21_14_0_10_32_42]|nr:MAG: hypothetical protein COU58_01400 [Candidatus Pacearchaeota archaeon CG10_big_fil_rev_8_21_14_0_10_32_42]